MKSWIWLLCLILLDVQSASAQEEFPRIRFTGLLDVRYAHTDRYESWLDSGLGKNRYGGSSDRDSNLIRLSQASAVIRPAFTEIFSAHVQVNVDADPYRSDIGTRVDLIEAFLSYRPVLNPYLRLKIRAGMFFPPVSLENTGPAWTSEFTITSSAINSWIGEEIKATGGELTLVSSRSGNEFSVTGALFGSNDPAGSLLAYRGWAIHDRQTGVGDHLPLPPLPAFQPDGVLPKQAPFVDPVREIDGRLGYYATAAWKNRRFDLTGIYYNNRGIPTDFDGTQYAWNTDFLNVGIEVPLPHAFEILSQYMTGRTKMGKNPAGFLVDAQFRSFYALISDKFGPHRLTARYDWIDVIDQDQYKAEDNSQENGSAWTMAYLLNIHQHYRLGFEYLRIQSDRPARQTLNLPAEEIETLLQASFRIIF